MLKIIFALMLAYTPSIIKDIENVQVKDDVTTAIITLNDQVPNRKGSLFIKVSETRKVLIKVSPIGDSEFTTKLEVRWTERTGIDVSQFKNSICSIVN